LKQLQANNRNKTLIQFCFSFSSNLSFTQYRCPHFSSLDLFFGKCVKCVAIKLGKCRFLHSFTHITKVVVERDCIYMFWLENFLWVSTKNWDKCGWGGDLREVAFTCFEWRNSFGHLLKMRQGWLYEKNVAFYMFWMESFSQVLGKKWEKGARRRREGLHLHFLCGEILEGLKMR
jgi:hypothetical protein